MASTDEIDIERVASLARLALSAEEKAEYTKQIGDILHHIEQLKRVDVSTVEPTAHAFPLFNVWREDVPLPSLAVAAALQNAPAQRNHMISVPKVVE
jgi:aspartyl-tRNA(Asn)/glutamyl-tRNA(Gln) amidotransferase subunit C